MSKSEAKELISEFFQREAFSSEEVRKIKRIAMKFNIKIGNYRRLFCKKCLSKLGGKLRVGKIHKTVECGICGHKNRHKLV
jgi:RNase P subunit RPR2